ncbi:MAG: hypothetical protein AAFP77_17075 [Bacteroidota bacterium]
MKYHTLALIAILLLAFSCNGDDDPSPSDMSSMTVVKDGETFTITDFNNTLLKEEMQGEPGRRLDLRCDVDGGQFILSVSNWDFQNPPEDGIVIKSYASNEDPFDLPANSVTECMDGGNFTFCDGALGTYIIDNVIYSSEMSDDNFVSIITITENDDANRTVSGTFDIKVQSFGTNPASFIEFTGSFTDLEYTVQ